MKITKTGGALYQRIADSVRQRIDAGTYALGEALPTVRALSRELRVNERTVCRAYDLLERGGYVQVVHGSGVYVEAKGASRAQAAASTLRKLVGCVGMETIETHGGKALKPGRGGALPPAGLCCGVDVRHQPAGDQETVWSITTRACFQASCSTPRHMRRCWGWPSWRPPKAARWSSPGSAPRPRRSSPSTSPEWTTGGGLSRRPRR